MVITPRHPAQPGDEVFAGRLSVRSKLTAENEFEQRLAAPRLPIVPPPYRSKTCKKRCERGWLRPRQPA